MKPAAFLLPFLLLADVGHAQFGFGPQAEDREKLEIPLLSPAERKAVETQREEFAKAFGPATSTAAKSTVRIWYKMRRGGDFKAAYGTVIGDGTKILTKWSQVANAVDDFRVEDANREVRAVSITGVYPDEDLAILTIEGEPLTPVTWTNSPLTLGKFLVASQPDGKPAGYGVVSVLERNLRKTDQAFLGIKADIRHTGDGVQVLSVENDTGAAAAGLKKGDVILRVSDRAISGLLELQNALWGAKPGTEIELLVRKGTREETVKVILGKKPELRQFAADRLIQMERMGGPLSKVREGFSSAVETDMVIEPENIGGPVANLQGEVVGVTMSRAGRTRSYIMPAAAVQELLKKETTDPALALAERKNDAEERLAMRAREAPPSGQQMAPPDPQEMEKMKRHSGDMARLMERIRSELQALENGE